MPDYQVYTIANSQNGTHGQDQYAVREGGSGGRILGRSLRLDEQGAEELARLLAHAFEVGRQDVLGG